MPPMTPDNMFILICDLHGELVWSSDSANHRLGSPAWDLVHDDDVDQTKIAIARAASLRETQSLEARSRDDANFRMWLWPLDRSDAAICILCLRVPAELSKLTDREKDCLGLLAQGMSTKLIASELGIGLSTVHTHVKRIREKLNLPRVETLISYAARYFFPEELPTQDSSNGSVKKQDSPKQANTK